MWFRRDLRLGDNPALLAACESPKVVPLFVVDPFLWKRSGPVRRAYLVASLRALDESLGGALAIRTGDPVAIVPQVAAEAGATSVHIAADYAEYGQRRDDAVESALRTSAADVGVELQRLGSAYAVAPGRIKSGGGTPYKVYSPFQRAWVEHGWRGPVAPPGDPKWLRLDSEELPSAPVPKGLELPPAGEKAALARWEAFRDGSVEQYDETRNLPGVPGTSGLSVPLRWGEIHPRTILGDLAQSGSSSKAALTFRKELAWREFYADVLWHNPASAREDLKPDWSAMEYDEPGPSFEAWKDGRTGFPMVDAGMRELRATGLMHNRVRMIVASFLVKDLHVWWRHGARHFMEWLVDGDLASNQHNWQWVAGSGADAAPYFRVFNPTSQGKKFDPNGDYIRRWVPELSDVPSESIHEPGPVNGYPAPIVDHAAERAESLRRYEQIKSN